MPLRNSLLHSIDSSMRFMPAALRNHMLLLTRLINNVVFMVNSITDGNMDTESFSIQGARMLYIKTSRKIRSKNKDMVFFDAAAEVLGFGGLYGAYAIDRGLVIPKEIHTLFLKISEHLFTVNKKAIEEIDWDELPNMGGIEWSLNFALKEQKEVERILEGENLTENNKDAMNILFNIPQNIHPVFAAARYILGCSIDFFSLQDRVLVGRLFILLHLYGPSIFRKMTITEYSIIISDGVKYHSYSMGIFKEK